MHAHACNDMQNVISKTYKKLYKHGSSLNLVTVSSWIVANGKESYHACPLSAICHSIVGLGSNVSLHDIRMGVKWTHPLPPFLSHGDLTSFLGVLEINK
jgi:hypothetical protein